MEKLEELAEGFVEICDEEVHIEGNRTDPEWYIGNTATLRIVEYLKKLTNEDIKLILIERAKRIVDEKGEIEILRNEADAEYGYKVYKDYSVEGIGEYQDPSVTKLDQLNIVDLADLIFVNGGKTNGK